MDKFTLKIFGKIIPQEEIAWRVDCIKKEYGNDTPQYYRSRRTGKYILIPTKNSGGVQND